MSKPCYIPTTFFVFPHSDPFIRHNLLAAEMVIILADSPGVYRQHKLWMDAGILPRVPKHESGY